MALVYKDNSFEKIIVMCSFLHFWEKWKKILSFFLSRKNAILEKENNIFSLPTLIQNRSLHLKPTVGFHFLSC